VAGSNQDIKGLGTDTGREERVAKEPADVGKHELPRRQLLSDLAYAQDEADEWAIAAEPCFCDASLGLEHDSTRCSR
jgi:hypothetical protein